MTEIESKKPKPDRFVIASLILAACMSAFTSLVGFGIALTSSVNNVWGKLLVCEAATFCCFASLPTFLLIVFFSRTVLARAVCAESAVIFIGMYVASWQERFGVRTLLYPARIAFDTLRYTPALVPLCTAALVVFANRHEHRQTQPINGAKNNRMVTE